MNNKIKNNKIIFSAQNHGQKTVNIYIHLHRFVQNRTLCME